MSAYYHAEHAGSSMRNWFVGTLVALGALLHIYKGFTPKENFLLDAAGLLAVGVAIFPMDPPSANGGALFSFHGVVAFLAFGCLAWVALFTASNTLKLMDESRRQWYGSRYKTLGILMVASPAVAYFLNVFFRLGLTVLIAEALCLWVFAAYWFLKGHEMHELDAFLRKQASPKA